jgi:hypothetical protein
MSSFELSPATTTADWGSFGSIFPSPDPAGFAAVDPTNPQSWNRYAYVLNNPLAMVDPTGLCGGLISDPPGQDCMGQFPGSGANNGNINDCTTASCIIYVYAGGPGDVQNPGQCYEILLDGVDTGKNTCGTVGGGQTNGGGGPANNGQPQTSQQKQQQCLDQYNNSSAGQGVQFLSLYNLATNITSVKKWAEWTAVPYAKVKVLGWISKAIQRWGCVCRNHC